MRARDKARDRDPARETLHACEDCQECDDLGEHGQAFPPAARRDDVLLKATSISLVMSVQLA